MLFIYNILSVISYLFLQENQVKRLIKLSKPRLSRSRRINRGRRLRRPRWISTTVHSCRRRSRTTTHNKSLLIYMKQIGFGPPRIARIRQLLELYDTTRTSGRLYAHYIEVIVRYVFRARERYRIRYFCRTHRR